MLNGNAVAQLKRHTAAIVPKDGLEDALARAKKERRPLIVKLGLDPTAPDIHLGHTVVLRKLRQFQDLGHTVVLIVGDFTAKIGDPSGKSATRPQLSDAKIKANAATYQKQVLKVLTKKNLAIRFNSEWLAKLSAADILMLMGKSTVAQVLVREDFRRRLFHGDSHNLNEQSDLGLHEILYPLLQAYDSVAIHADIEIGGTDQTVNLLMGRKLQRRMGQEPQIVMTMPLIPGTDGKDKMSKSLGNYIGILEPAEQMYGKIMSLPDELILPYMRLVSDIPDQDIPKRREDIAGAELRLKHKLALSVTCLYHGERAALKAQEQFRATFQSREFPKDAKKLSIDHELTLLDFLSGEFQLLPSKSEARRKIVEGAVRVNGKKVTDGTMSISPKKGEMIELKIGKRGFYRVTRQ